MGLSIVLPSIYLHLWSVNCIRNPIALFDVVIRPELYNIVVFEHSSSNFDLLLLLEVLCVMHVHIQTCTFIIRISFLRLSCCLTCYCSSLSIRGSIRSLTLRSSSWSQWDLLLIFNWSWGYEIYNMNWRDSVFSCISIWQIVRCWNFISW